MESQFETLFESRLNNIIQQNISPTEWRVDELEIRFGNKQQHSFNTDVGKENFDKILKKYNISENKVITDWIYRKNVLKSFDKKYQNLTRQHTSEVGSKTTPNFNDYDDRKFILVPDLQILQKERNVKITDLSMITEKKIKSEEKDDKKRRKFLENNKPIFQSKEKKKVYTQNNMRFTHAIEHKLDFKEEMINNREGLLNLTHKNIPYDSVRLKHRFFKHIGMWRLDLTEVQTLDLIWMRGSSLKSKTYQIEIEFDIEKYMKTSKKPNIVDLMTQLKSLIDKIMDRLTPFTSNQTISFAEPHTLERSNLNKLENYPYSVTDKADGERMFLHIIDMNNIYLKNPKTNAIKRIIQVNDEYKDEVKDTIIDGEYLEPGTFYAFDIPSSPDKFLKERLEILKSVVKKIKNVIDIKISVKKFYFENVFTEAKKIWDTKSSFKYNLDGLIFTPIEQPYIPDKNIPILKWKDHHTIDVRLEYNRRHDFNYFHFFSKKNTVYEWPEEYADNDTLKRIKKIRSMNQMTIGQARFTLQTNNPGNNYISRDLARDFVESGIIIPENEINARTDSNRYFLGIKGALNKLDGENILNKYDIIEFEFQHKPEPQWKPIRRRTFDKPTPNAHRTIMGTLKAICENITITNISKLKYSKKATALYDKVVDKTISREPWRQFNNFVKTKLLIAALPTSHDDYREQSRRPTRMLLDLGSGRGGDFHKWKNLGYTDILAIDISQTQLDEFKDRLLKGNYVENYGTYSKDNLNITIIWGDVSKNIRNGEAGNNNIEKNKLIRFFRKRLDTGFDTISIMFVIHYLFANKEIKDRVKFEGFMKNIQELLKPNGYFIGTYLDGKKLNKLAGKKKKLSFKYTNRKLFYEIELKEDAESGSRKYEKYWEKDIRMIDVKTEVWPTFISEPQIYSDVLNLLFEKHGLFRLSKNVSFESFYKDFLNDKKFGKKDLSPDEKVLTFLHNVFVYSFKK